MDFDDPGTSASDVFCAFFASSAACGGGGVAITDAALCADVAGAYVYQLRAREAADRARLEQTLAVLEHRMQGPELCELEATIDPDGQITLRVVSLADGDALDTNLLEPGVVAFYEVDETHSTSDIVPGIAILPDRAGSPFVVKWTSLLPSEPIAQAEVVETAFGPAISIVLTSEAATAFGDVTTNLLDHRLAIVVDDVVLTAPTIREPIRGGSLQISGDYSAEEAFALAAILDGGQLPDGIRLVLESVDVEPRVQH